MFRELNFRSAKISLFRD